MTGIPADALLETWDSVYNKSLALAVRIEADCKTRNEHFDTIVVVPRGSYYTANIVARELGFKALDLLHACIGTHSDKSTKNDGFELGQMPAAADVAGKNLLIIEEVCDSGRTLQFLVKRLKKQGAGLVRTAVLLYKPGGSKTNFVPDWFVAKSDDWIVYPWELHDGHGLASKVKKPPIK